MSDRIGGVELLALYGDNDRIGFSLKKVAKKGFGYTPQGALYNLAMKKTEKRRKRMHGDDSRIGAFLPGLKKVGKVTGKFTGAVAKAFIPASIVDAAAKMDPTKKNASAKQAVTAIAPAPAPAKKAIVVPKTILGIDTKKVVFIGGGAVAALVVLKVLLGSSRRS